MRLMIVLDREEIKERIPYAMICETRYGMGWGTMRRKRRWKEEFSEKERDACRKLFALAYSWYLVKGVPDEVKMNVNTLALWEKLGEFCFSL